MLRGFRIGLDKLLDHPFGDLWTHGGQNRLALVNELRERLIAGVVTVEGGGHRRRQLSLFFRSEVGKRQHLRQGGLQLFSILGRNFGCNAVDSMCHRNMLPPKNLQLIRNTYALAVLRKKPSL